MSPTQSDQSVAFGTKFSLAVYSWTEAQGEKVGWILIWAWHAKHWILQYSVIWKIVCNGPDLGKHEQEEKVFVYPLPTRLSSHYKREQISQSHIVAMAPLLKLLLLALVCCSSVSAEEEVSSRSKRLFYVSTTSSTSTLKTQSICFVSSTTLAACRKKKKRSLGDISSYDSQNKINPTGSRWSE